ncbi:MAG: NAD(P)/FAD-dependent oxidoreductase [Tetrasphaera jenkinsii]|jgi:NADH:ubiquinone reductase (H+-translocating)|nr:NAD(P)/FAD-dependent oxidoreductase [Tetrasphaera jenkinsii]
MDSARTASPKRPTVVIIGSGFGGLFAARALAKDDVDVVLIAKTSHHLFQPLLYQVATGILSQGEIAPSTREVLAKQKNATVVLGEVTAIDVTAQTVTASLVGEQFTQPYDYLIVAAGAAQSWFGHDEFAEYAPGMKSIDDALELRGRIFGAFELAEVAAKEGRHDEVGPLMTFVVVGAGPTGVEMAGQLVELSNRTLRRDFRHISPADAKIILADAAPSVLGSFHPKLQDATKKSLEKLGVDVRLDAMVTGVDERGITVRRKAADGATTDERIEAVTKVWAAGVAASPLAKQLADQVGVQVDRAGRIPVQPDLTLVGHPEIHVVGDMMTLDKLPGVAQVAIQGARHSAKEIRRHLKGEPTGAKFTYFDKGSMATISRFRAIAEIGSIRLTGFVAWLAWLGVHLVYIIGFKSRLTSLISWAVSFIGRGRAERTITEQQVFGRQAIERLAEIEAAATKRQGTDAA